MELSQLKYFYTAAAHEHITRAAEELHVAQPALTQSIRRLEKELGFSLFTRQGRGVKLTIYGTYLMKRLTPIFKTLENLPAELAELAQKENNTIRINIRSASALITRAIIAYQRTVGPVNFKMVQETEDDSCDIIITGGPIEEQWMHDNMEYHVFKENILLAVPKDSLYTAQGSVSLAKMSETEFISLTGQRQFRSVCDSYCMEAGFVPKTAFESDNVMAVQGLIGAGQGIGFWPEYSWGNINEDIVTLIPIAAPVCQRNLTFIFRSQHYNSTVQREFYDFLIQYISEIKSK